MKAKTNDKVKVHYIGKFISGEVFDSSENREPLEFTIGVGEMIKGFDDAVNGMELKEKKTVTIPSDDAYGKRHEELIYDVPKSQLSDDMKKPEVGQKLVTTDDNGHHTYVNITAVSDDTITVDENHDLVEKDLVFEIELVEIS